MNNHHQYSSGLWFFLLPADVDECAMATHNCHELALCNNTVGSFNCSCRNGYTGDGLVCKPIGERLKNVVEKGSLYL